MDTDFDEKLSLAELRTYIQTHQLPFEEGILEQMYKDACKGRGFISNKQMQGPLSRLEVAAAVRGRHCWDTAAKCWYVRYRPFRDYWICLLLTVNTKIFALPMPRVVPEKIRAQFEIEEASDLNDYLNVSLPKAKTLYKSVSSIHKPPYIRNPNKAEGKILPDVDRSITMVPDRCQTQITQHSAYETQINNRLRTHESVPRISFSAQAVYEEVRQLSQQIPYWQDENQNPINTFLPER